MIQIKYKCGCKLIQLGKGSLSEWDQCKKHRDCENINRCKLELMKSGETI